MIETATGERPWRGLAVFLLFAFAAPWTIWLAVRAQSGSEGLGHWLPFMIAPGLVSIGGFAAALAQGGRRGLTDFFRRTAFSRVRLVPLILAPLLVFAAGLLTFVTHPDDLTGQGQPNPMIWLGALTLMNLWTGPVAEEFGLRGFLQPWLEQRMALLPAALLTGLLWVVWHWPLFMDSLFADARAAGGYAVWVISWAVALAVLTRLANGNLAPAILMHLCMNTQADMFSALLPLLDGAYLPSGWALSLASLLVGLLSLLLLRSTGWQRRQ